MRALRLDGSARRIRPEVQDAERTSSPQGRLKYRSELIDHGTKQAVVQWIRSRPEPALDLPRLAGSELIEVSESNPLLLGPSAGNCKGLHAHGVRGGASTTKSVGAPAIGIRGGHEQGADLAPRPHRLTHLRQVAGGL